MIERAKRAAVVVFFLVARACDFSVPVSLRVASALSACLFPW